jgi:RNA polymerase sigma-70 factor (ECF subfamily)
MDGFLRGEAEAVRQLGEWILPVVKHRTWAFGEQQQDLVQDIHLKLLHLFREAAFRGDSSLKTYVQATAKYTCLDAVRSARIRETESLDEGEPFATADDDPVESLSRRQSERLCHRVLHSLAEPCRHMFRMVLEEELSYEDIAQRLDIGLGTVKSRLARCRAKAVTLRRQILERDDALGEESHA